jgi:hypothetical protein
MKAMPQASSTASTAPAEGSVGPLQLVAFKRAGAVQNWETSLQLFQFFFARPLGALGAAWLIMP